MSAVRLEDRMAALEEAVRQLQQAVNARQRDPHWMDRVIGSMKSEPAFDEVLAHGRALRQADGLAEDEGA